MKFEPFDNIFKDSTSNFTKVKKEDYQNVGAYPIVDQGQAFIGGYTDDENLVVTENLPVIIFGDHTKIFKYVDFPFTIGADGVKVLTLKNQKDNALFYYYFLKSIRIVDKGYSRHFKYLKEKKFPVAEYPDQLHIANLLSKAENLIAQRKESIRLLDEFLKSTFLEMFGDPVRNEKKWRVVPFNDVGKFKSGGTPSKSRADFWDGYFPWVSPKDMKVSKILDSQDHISELVFNETTLKRIPRNHLLIVVRGMILAHSFPIAINDTEVAINQDMKAIQPISDLNIVYLQHCLNAMIRQILDLMSSAGHGTRKFDTSAMQKLLIPVPPIELQTQFAKIVEKTESLKTQYQQSLQELENMYGSLSQRAFRGELTKG